MSTSTTTPSKDEARAAIAAQVIREIDLAAHQLEQMRAAVAAADGIGLSGIGAVNQLARTSEALRDYQNDPAAVTDDAYWVTPADDITQAQRDHLAARG